MPYVQAQIYGIGEVIRTKSEQYGAVCLDLWNMDVSDRGLFSEDGFHPSTKGHQELAARAFQLLTGIG